MPSAIRQEIERRIDDVLRTHSDIAVHYLNDAELADARKRRAEASASLACEGMDLTAEDEAMFDVFEERRYAHDTCGRLIIECLRHKAQRRQAQLVR